MRLRPSEVRLVVSLLENEEFEDETECAKAIVAALDEMRGRDRMPYVLLVRHPAGEGQVTHAYGPYNTANDARRAYKRGIGQVGESDQVMVLPMTTPEQALAAYNET